MKIRNLFLALALTTLSSFAADIDGKWSGSIDGPTGAISIAYSFKAEGSTLTGSMTGLDGAEVKIADGKVDGNKISFNVTLDFGGMPFTMAYKGELAGANLTLTSEFAGMPFEMALKKA